MGATTLSGVRNRSGADRRNEIRRAVEHVLFGVVPIAAIVGLLIFAFSIHGVAVDFRSAYYPAGLRLLHGGNAYAVTQQEILGARAFVYPALAAVAFAPFGFLSRGVAEIVYMLMCIACVPATLWVLRVRDWRIYGVAMLWLPVYSAWQTANVTLPLALLVALAWRYRDRPRIAGLIAATAISLKPFVWPLALWLLATRRLRATVWTLVWGVAVNLAVWWIVGFDEIHVYLRLSGEVTDALWRGGYSMLAVAHHVGFGRGVGEALLVTVSAALAFGVLYMGAVRRRDREALTLAVVLMLTASPLVWSHYFTLLLVPLAIGRPWLGPLWVLPLLMWPCPPAAALGWEVALAWGVAAACCWPLVSAKRQSAAFEHLLPAADHRPGLETGVS